jgi:predicted ester cyclase
MMCDALWTAFPDLTVHAQDYAEENDKVSFRFELTGTDKVPFQAIPATGRPIHDPDITIRHFREGKCVER